MTVRRARPLTRALSVIALATAVVVAAAVPAAAAKPKWIQRIEDVVGDRPVSVAIGNDGDYWYRHLAWVRRPPASNEKLLLSMALFSRFSPDRRIKTSIMREGRIVDGVVRGDIWLVGRGDPEVDGKELRALAQRVADAGIRRIRGSVLGHTGPFSRDWWATGWRDYFPTYYIARPTALTFRRNEDLIGRHIADPERRAAAGLTHHLEDLGIPVTGSPRAGRMLGGTRMVASIRSAPLQGLVRRMNVDSRNFWAEVLGKYLGRQTSGVGSIARGAAAICDHAAALDLVFTCEDSSGLSYANRATALGILQLLWAADDEPWGSSLRATLPAGGQGTLEDRLTDVRLRAKTGTLVDVSALSGWIWLERSREWAEFSILSSGFDEHAAKKIENAIVRVVSANASDPQPEPA